MNEAVAGLLREYAELLAITGGDPFRARNYEKAAKAVAGHPADVTAMPDSDVCGGDIKVGPIKSAPYT